MFYVFRVLVFRLRTKQDSRWLKCNVNLHQGDLNRFTLISQTVLLDVFANDMTYVLHFRMKIRYFKES